MLRAWCCVCARSNDARALTCVKRVDRPVDLHDPLRVRRMKRRIKIACCITMYNEEAVFLQVRNAARHGCAIRGW